jgi:hypothetical protein
VEQSREVNMQLNTLNKSGLKKINLSNHVLQRKRRKNVFTGRG